METPGTLARGDDLGAEVDATAGTITFVGTATVLLRYAGFAILTDPNFLHQGEQVHIGYGLRSTRRTNPAMELEDLPPLDFVVLSHMHEDHFDRVVQQRLDKSLTIVTTPQAAGALARIGFAAVRPLNTWASTQFSKGGFTAQVTALPALHAPRPLAPLFPPVMGSMIEFADPLGALLLRVYVSGDTLLFDQIAEIPRRFPDIDIALLHLGGTRIGAILLTMDAKQGVEALRILQPDTALPIHYADYTVFKSPLREFQREVGRAGLTNRVKYLRRGIAYDMRIPASRSS